MPSQIEAVAAPLLAPLFPDLPPEQLGVLLLALSTCAGAGMLLGGAGGSFFGLWFGTRLGAGAAKRSADQLSSGLENQFHAISSAALDRSSDRLLDLAGERLSAVTRSNDDALARREQSVDAMVRPLRETLSKVDEKLQQVETARVSQQASLTEHLDHLAEAHRQLEAQTQSLSQALRNPNARGRWGELHLRRVVELAGMTEHCDFSTQVHLAAEPGGEDERGGARPDLVMQLPGGREIAIDAKAPLDAYLLAAEATDEAERQKHLVAHAKQVRRHLDALAGRSYWSRLRRSPEFVVLYLPGEPMLADAAAMDPELIERGAERKVLLAGPTTLIALLRSAAFGWQQESMTENAEAIHDLGVELFDRIATLGEHFGTLGKRLDGAVESYNQAIGSFETRVQVSARRMAELGRATPEKLREHPPIERRTRKTEVKNVTR